jgi:hypothetical protein
MLKIIKSDKDSYITNKIVQGSRKVDSNVGSAGTLDLYKLYGVTFSGSVPNSELSRLLVHFNLDSLKDLVQQGKIDITDPSFWCELRLRDVYGGQPNPVNFTVSVFPLSASFDEGIGRDVSYYSDRDVCNWITSSLGLNWFVTGSGLACDAQTSAGDYITSSISLASTEKTQTFIDGTEDLIVDVTNIISATLSGEIPNSGFRISFKENLENDNKTYFVKRFASRQAFDETKHPSLVIGFDDSITDDSQNLVFDSPCSLTLYNYSGGSYDNIVSGSSLTQITGSNCLLLRLETPVSGGSYSLYFTGSQFGYGSLPVSGVYQTTFTIPSSDSVIKTKLTQSGSIEFTPIWTSLDKSVSYTTGSLLTMFPQTRSSRRNLKKYVVSVHDLNQSYTEDEEVNVRVNIFDQTSPMIKAVKTPVEIPGIVLKNVHYQIRDVVTDEVVIPFDDLKNSTKVSSDSSGMFFKFYTSSLILGRTYVVDIMINNNGIKTKYESSSPVFRIESAI